MDEDLSIINANTRLANTMNGKTQWFLFSNIFFTEPWEGGADWTGEKPAEGDEPKECSFEIIKSLPRRSRVTKFNG